MIRFNRYAVALAIMFAAVSISIDAQWVRYPTADVPRGRDGTPNLAAPAPLLPNGKPDFSGVWSNDGIGAPGQEGTGPVPKIVFFDLSNGMKGITPPYQPWAAVLYAKRKDEQAKDNPDARCLPIGALQMLAHPLPKKILHNPRLLVILHERNMEFRQIFLDGRPLPEDPQPSWYGYSTGRWEGDTLVVDTIGFRDGLWADFWGSPLTDRARMTERIRRPRFGALDIEVTIDDPKAYTKPWTVSVNQHLALDTELLEYACLENERDVPRLVGK
ncbi:MAG TPA: hypothetical protein VKA59_11900 [Vicinamibacterales bacterium]|nr:hypothetical protein [Vicinamibacterales bacterium]